MRGGRSENTRQLPVLIEREPDQLAAFGARDVDFTQALALPLPDRATGSILGIANEDATRLHAMVRRLRVRGGVTGVGRDWTVKACVVAEMHFSEALESRHGNPRGDLLSEFVAATYEASDSETRDDPLRCPLCSTSRTEAAARLCRRSRCHRAQR